MRRSFLAGLIAAVSGLATLAPISHATANDTIDMTETGSLPTPGSEPSASGRGSAQFQSLLPLLGQDAAAAFAQAADLSNPVERRAVEWAAIYFHPGAVDFNAIAKFAAEAPNFASASVYRTRIEQSLAKSDVAEAQTIAVLGGSEPETIDGQIMLASAYLAGNDVAQAKLMARGLWVNNFLTTEQEALVLSRFGSLLDRGAHWQRAMYLMMHDRARGSERLLGFLDAAQQSLVVARAAVSRNDADAKKLLDAVDPTMQSNPVYIYSRAQRARQFELWDSAVDWLNKAPPEPPEAAEWWYERRTLIRKLLEVGLPRLAYDAAAGYSAGPEGRLVEAHFHAGWIALSFLKEPEVAKTHFIAMNALSTLADSVTQANYWLARANTAIGDTAAAKIALEKAAEFSTVYYGQLARAELGLEGVDIRPLPAWIGSEAAFNDSEVVQAIRLLIANGERNLAIPLLRHYGNGQSDPGQLLLAAKLAQDVGANNLAVSIANTADQRGAPLDLFSFPHDGLPDNAPLAADRAAVYAVVRQESMFQLDAVSSAGARGLMQLMPGTAKDVARDLGVDYSATRLVSDAAYNALLGSTYLNTQLERYDGSLVLAAAAYNAGPGNADKWVRTYGDPRATNVDPVIWVELIPFQETRTYVKRVLGNYLVYRERLGANRITLLQALRTID